MPTSTRSPANARSIGSVDPKEALDALHEALALWRGPALADLRDGGISSRAYPYDEERRTAIEDAFDLEFDLGRYDEAIPQIETCLLDDPYRERLWGQLMLALYRSGRQADALKAFGRARERLVGDLGIDPDDGVVRVSLVHYNSLEEIDRLIALFEAVL